MDLVSAVHPHALTVMSTVALTAFLETLLVDRESRGGAGSGLLKAPPLPADCGGHLAGHALI